MYLQSSNSKKQFGALRIKIQLILIAAAALVMAFTAQKGHAVEKSTEVGKGSPQKEWTFLLFLNGHNNLDSYGKMNLNSMEEVGSTAQVNLVVQWASLANKETRRMLMLKDKDTKNVTSPILQKLAPVDMGDYKELVNFVEWGVKNYPAKKYFIAVWNHGSGWHRIGKNMVRDISFDDNTGNTITTEQLGLAMQESMKITGDRIELYGSDACLMGMIEVAAEMKDSVKYFAGSQDLEPGEGWPYNTFIQKWIANPTMDGAELASVLTSEYIKAYQTGGVYKPAAVTFSAFDMSRYNSVAQSMGALSKAIMRMNTSEVASLKNASQNAYAFYYDDYRDVLSLLGNMKSSGIKLQSEMLDAENATSKFVIANGATGNFKGQAMGMSVWLPMDSYSLNQYETRYSQLQFNKDTDWLEVIKLVNQ